MFRFYVPAISTVYALGTAAAVILSLAGGANAFEGSEARFTAINQHGTFSLNSYEDETALRMQGLLSESKDDFCQASLTVYSYLIDSLLEGVSADQVVAELESFPANNDPYLYTLTRHAAAALKGEWDGDVTLRANPGFSDFYNHASSAFDDYTPIEQNLDTLKWLRSNRLEGMGKASTYISCLDHISQPFNQQLADQLTFTFGE